MDDLISRKALKKAIAAAWTNYNTCPDYNELFKYFCDVVSAMSDELPAVDAVEVVRCKDCVNMGKRPPLPNGYREDCGWGVMNGHAVLPEDFCSNGETADGKCLREAAEQDAYEQLCNLGNPEDGSL